MERPSKKQIKEALEKMKEGKSGGSVPEYTQRPLEGKKDNKNRIRKKGV